MKGRPGGSNRLITLFAKLKIYFRPAYLKLQKIHGLLYVYAVVEILNTLSLASVFVISVTATPEQY